MIGVTGVYFVNYPQIKWLGGVYQQAITWANIDPDLCHQIGSPDHNELNCTRLNDVAGMAAIGTC